MARFVNPLKMGLLGGLANWANEMEKYNLLNRQIAGRTAQYQIKYDAQERMAKMRAQANTAANLAAAESRQKIWEKPVVGDDGKTRYQKIKSHVDPSNPTGPWIDSEMGDPYEKPGQKPVAPVVKTMREGGQDVTKQWDPDKKEWVQLGSGPHFNPVSGANTDAVNARNVYDNESKNARLVQAENMKRATLVQKGVDAANNEWQRGDAGAKAAMAKAAGINPNDPDAKKKVMDAVRAQLQDNYKQEPVPVVHPLGEHDSNGANSPGGAESPRANVAIDQNGNKREIRYKGDQPFMLGPDGKPQPVHINDKGVATDAPPLAFDDPKSTAAIAQAGGGAADDDGNDTENDNDEDDGGAKFVTDEGPSQEEQDASDREDEDEDENQQQQQPRAGLTSYG